MVIFSDFVLVYKTQQLPVVEFCSFSVFLTDYKNYSKLLV